MPNKNKHLKYAAHNDDFSDLFDYKSTPFRDWVATIKFYEALHYIEAYLATKKIHSSDHRARDSVVSRESKLRHISSEYRLLKDDSTNARYSGFMPSAHQLKTQTDRNLSVIKQHIMPLL